MKLKWTQSAYEKGKYVNPGDEFEADDTTAKTLIEQGRAEAVGGKDAKHEDDDSPVDNLTVHQAADKISRMLSKEKLQGIASTDQRAGVQEAAKKRLAELG